MRDHVPGLSAQVLRHGAALATDVQEISADYGTALVAPGSFADALFRQDSAQSLRDGYVFKPGPTLKGGQFDRSDWGYWACEIADHNRLTWSDTVYDLFGLAPNALVDRDWAVGRYVGHSRLTLQRVREFALRHAWGFILDAEIEPENGHRRWIRVLAVPVSEDGRVTRLHGLKRAL